MNQWLKSNAEKIPKWAFYLSILSYIGSHFLVCMYEKPTAEPIFGYQCHILGVQSCIWFHTLPGLVGTLLWLSNFWIPYFWFRTLTKKPVKIAPRIFAALSPALLLILLPTLFVFRLAPGSLVWLISFPLAAIAVPSRFLEHASREELPAA